MPHRPPAETARYLVEDKGAAYALTDAERQTIAVYPMDLGGQFWARQNTGFAAFTNGDPVTPAGATP